MEHEANDLKFCLFFIHRSLFIVDRWSVDLSRLPELFLRCATYSEKDCRCVAAVFSFLPLLLEPPRFPPPPPPPPFAVAEEENANLEFASPSADDGGPSDIKPDAR